MFSIFCYVSFIPYYICAVPFHRIDQMLLSFNCNGTPNFLHGFPNIFNTIWFYSRYSFLYDSISLFEYSLNHFFWHSRCVFWVIFFWKTHTSSISAYTLIGKIVPYHNTTAIMFDRLVFAIRWPANKISETLSTKKHNFELTCS